MSHTHGHFSFRSAAFRCTVFKTRKETATNTVRTIGQAFDVVHRIVEAEKDQNNNLDNLDNAETEKEIVFSPRKSIKSNKVIMHKTPGIEIGRVFSWLEIRFSIFELCDTIFG